MGFFLRSVEVELRMKVFWGDACNQFIQIGPELNFAEFINFVGYDDALLFILCWHHWEWRGRIVAGANKYFNI